MIEIGTSWLQFTGEKPRQVKMGDHNGTPVLNIDWDSKRTSVYEYVYEYAGHWVYQGSVMLDETNRHGAMLHSAFSRHSNYLCKNSSLDDAIKQILEAAE